MDRKSLIGQLAKTSPDFKNQGDKIEEKTPTD